MERLFCVTAGGGLLQPRHSSERMAGKLTYQQAGVDTRRAAALEHAGNRGDDEEHNCDEGDQGDLVCSPKESDRRVLRPWRREVDEQRPDRDDRARGGLQEGRGELAEADAERRGTDSCEACRSRAAEAVSARFGRRSTGFKGHGGYGTRAKPGRAECGWIA